MPKKSIDELVRMEVSRAIYNNVDIPALSTEDGLLSSESYILVDEVLYMEVDRPMATISSATGLSVRHAQ